MSSRLRRQSGLAIPALLIFVAGCGVAPYNSASGTLAVTSSASSTSSNGQVQFSARLSSGASAPVTWSVAGGDNAQSLGEGHINSEGLYTPPSALSQASVRVQVVAHLKAYPLQTAGESISITPGFVQPLLPENASLTAGATLQATAEIAEVNAGSVDWSLSSTPANLADKGTLSGAACQHSLDQYTTCKILYTAPESPAPAVVYLTASMNESSSTAPLKILLNSAGVNSDPLLNQSPQTGPIALGTSGGNDNDFDTYRDSSGQSYVADCCGGTLGALVQDSAHNQYILSNNHVLAESDQGRPGDTIDQPAMIDDGCVPLSHAGSTLRPVGTLKYVVPLATSNTDVDAALASVAPGAVDSAGSILQLAAPTRPVSASDILAAGLPVAGTGEVLTAANLAGLQLAKSGRTTGLTCSTVAALDLSVKVDYFKDCAETQPWYTKIFTGQIGITGNRFSDSGDSGALVVDASNAEPVGLFFAGGTDGKGQGLSIASPIGEVLRELGEQTGGGLSIVGTGTPHPVACIRYDTNPPAPAALVPTALAAHAKLVSDTAATLLINPDHGILAVSTGASLDSPGQPAIVIYTDKSIPGVNIPPTINGIRTQVIPTDPAALARDAAPKSPASVNGLNISASALATAKTVVGRNASRLLKDPAIFGVGVAQSLDDPQQPALLVLVDPSSAPRSMPTTIGGLRVRYMRLHRFHVTRSKYAGPNPAPTCALKKITGAGIATRSPLQP